MRTIRIFVITTAIMVANLRGDFCGHEIFRRIRDSVEIFKAHLDSLPSTPHWEQEVDNLFSALIITQSSQVKRRVCDYLIQKIGEISPYEKHRIYTYAFRKLWPSLDDKTQSAVLLKLVKMCLADFDFLDRLESHFGDVTAGRETVENSLLPLIQFCIGSIPLQVQKENKELSTAIDNLVIRLCEDLTPPNINTIRQAFLKTSVKVRERAILEIIDEYFSSPYSIQTSLAGVIKDLILDNIDHFSPELHLELYRIVTENFGCNQPEVKETILSIAKELANFFPEGSEQGARLLFFIKLFSEQ
ncbi:MAG: hypothetical protein J7J54_03025 [Candidatus Omnitrophica bacterium]|nr:hypothetical protein [Candidatus Omnitrophota bacterium]